MAFVQSRSNTASSVTSFTVTFTSATTGGNLILVAVSDDSTTTSEITSVTDNKSNAYTQISATEAGVGGTSFPTLTLYYAKNVTGGSSHTITVNTAGLGGSYGVVAQEFSGIVATSPLDVSHAASGSSSTAPASGSTPTTTAANEQVIGAVAFAGSAATPTAGSGYSNLGNASSASVNVAVESLTVSATGSQSASFTLPSAVSWACACVTFKLPGGGGGGSGTPTPAIPTFVNGTVYHASDLNALGSNLTNLYNYALSGFRTYKPITVVRITRTFTATHGAYTVVQFDTVDMQTDGTYDSFLTNESLLYLTVRSAGVYRLYLQFTRSPATSLTAIDESHICINGSSVATNAVSGTVIGGRATNTSAVVGLNVGDRISGVVWNGDTADHDSSLQYGGSYLVAEWISP